MTKQEFLAISLPYGLKMCYEYKDRIDIHTLLPMHFDCKFQLVNERGKPILHPLSDITKEIEHKGEKLVLIEKLLGKFEDGFSILLNDSWGIQVRDNRTQKVSTITFSNLSLNQAIKLISYHFDIAGLIEKGEAIDVNTLRENPYK